MRRLTFCTVALLVFPCLASGQAAPDPLPPAVDIAAVKADLRVYHDGKGHYFVLAHPEGKLDRLSQSFFYGDGKVFFKQRVPGAGANGQDFDCVISEPRVLRPYQSGFEHRGGKAHFRCEDRKTELLVLPPAEASKMLDGARFYGVYWRHVPHVLARDESGVYYLVDRLVNEDRDARQHTGFRVFVGMRGKMRRLRMKNVVSDSSGEIFITPNGQLRLIVDKADPRGNKAATWIAGKRRSNLSLVDHELPVTRVMIYRDLGVYSTIKLRRPCDDL